jgi:hypothetical protein
MKKIDFKKDIFPHLIAIILFIVVTILFYNPVFFENKQLNQHDILQGIGGGKELIDYRDLTGKEGLWTNSMFGGMPGYLINTQWSGDILQYVQRILSLGLPAPARYTFIMILCFYIMLLSFRIRPYLAMAGALGFGLSSFSIIGIMAGHIWRIMAIAFMPLVLAGIHLTFTNKKWIGLGLTALVLGLQIRANHLQMTYYLLIIILIYLLFVFIKYVREKEAGKFVLNGLFLVIPVVLAVGSNFGKIWTVLEYSKYSTRGKSELAATAQDQSGLDRDYVFQYSNSIFEPLVLIIPNIMGGASQQALGESSNLAEALTRNGLSRKQVSDQIKAVPTYWGKQPITAPYYAGIIFFFLFILGLFLVDKHIRYWLITVTLLSVVLSWGDNFKVFNYLVFDLLPGYNKFRSVTFTIIMAFITIPLGGMMGLEKFMQKPSGEKLKFLKYAVYITGGILLLALVFSLTGSFRGSVDERLSNVPSWFLDALRADRASILRMDIFRNGFFFLLAAFLLWRYSLNKLNSTLIYISFILLITLDAGLVSNRYISDDNYERNVQQNYFTPSAADKKMMGNQEDHYRVLNLQNPFNESRTSYFHQSIGGYHGAKMHRYQDLIERYISKEINEFITNFRQGKEPFSNLNVLNMLNTRYFYFGQEAEGVIENPDALGNAWFISDIQPVNNPDEEIRALNEMDPSATCVIDISRFPGETRRYSANGTIDLVAYRPGFLKYQYSKEDKGFAVFSEIYYPAGWKATIDGNPAEIKRVDYVLRGMEVPAGDHTVEFEFQPASYRTGNRIMLVFSLGTVLFFGFAAYVTLKNNLNYPDKV